MSDRYEEKAWEIVEGWSGGGEYPLLVSRIAAALREAEAETLHAVLKIIDECDASTCASPYEVKSGISDAVLIYAWGLGIEMEAKADG